MGKMMTTDAELMGVLRHDGLAAEWLSSGLMRLRGPAGRTVYVQERREPGETVWLVHADGLIREPARQYVCRTLALAIYRIETELAVR